MTFYLVIFLSLLVTTQAYPEHGITASTREDKLYTGNSWEKLTGWNPSTDSVGHYSSELSIGADQASIAVKKPGIYYVSLHVLLANLTGKDISIAVVLNNAYDSSPALFCAAKLNYATDLDASGFLQLSASDVMTVYVYSEISLQIYQNSFLSFRFHGYSSSVPGFLFSLQKTMELHANNQNSKLGRWLINGNGQFSSLSIFRENEIIVQAPVNGIYMLCANVIVTLFENNGLIELSLHVDDARVSLTKSYLSADSTTTININEILQLKAENRIALKISTADSRINVLDTSTFSLLLLKPYFIQSEGFRATLNSEHSISATEEFTRVSQWKTSANETVFNFKDFTTTSTIVDEKSFSTSVPGLFYVTMHLMFTLIMSDSHQNGSDIFYVALYKDLNSNFMQEEIQTQVQGNKSSDAQTYTVNLAGVFDLTPSKPISVAIKGTKGVIIFHNASSFSVLKIYSSYPGVHAHLSSPIYRTEGVKQVIGNWKTNAHGLFDFVNSLDQTSGVYTASHAGVYLVAASVVVEDVDNGILAYLSPGKNELNKAFYIKDGNPSQKMPLNLGGFMSMKENDKVSLFLEATNDQDWKVFRGGLTVSYIGLKPSYFQTSLQTDVTVVRGKNDVAISQWYSYPWSNLLNNGQYQVPLEGVYFTICSVVLGEADSSTFGSFYKIYLTINGEEVKGLYSIRRTSGVTPPASRRFYTLFFSGSFYAKQGSLLSIKVKSKDGSFTIMDASQWGIAYIPSTSLESGALTTLQSDRSYRLQTPWQDVSDWVYQDKKVDGTFELRNAIDFENPGHVTILKTGMFLISGNIELEYTGNKNPLVKVSVFINGDTNDNGLTQWLKLHSSETAHFCGTLFLQANDQVQVLISSTDFPATKVKMPSGLSFILLPEAKKPPSFAAFLQKIITVNATGQVIADWKFEKELSTPGFDTKNGLLTIPFHGYYLLSLALKLVRGGESTNGAQVSVLINGKETTHYSIDFRSTEDTLALTEVFELKAHDIVKFSITPIFNNTLIKDHYQIYLNKTNNDTTTGGNKTFVNPYASVGLMVKGNESSLSATYLKNFKPSKSSVGILLEDRDYKEQVSEMLLAPWRMPLDPQSLGGEGFFFVERNGVYLLSSMVMLSDVTNGVKISFVVDKKAVCISLHICNSSCNAVLHIKCLSFLHKNDMVSIKISTYSSNVKLHKDSKRVINYIAKGEVGYNAETQYLNATLRQRNWLQVGPWLVVSNSNDTSSNSSHLYGLYWNNFVSFENEFVALEAGIYQVTVNLIVAFTADNVQKSPLSLDCGVFINGAPNFNLFRNVIVDQQTSAVTINFIGSVSLLKWCRLELKLKSNMDKIIQILPGGTWSTVLMELLPHSRVVDAGPIMLSTLTPSLHRTHIMGKLVSWSCQAAADGPVIYRWYKDGELVLTDNSTKSEYKIKGYINDTGTYQCIAEYMGIFAPSNEAVVDLYDVDECLQSPCDSHAICENTPGSFKCTCLEKWDGDGLTCEDKNECATNPDICLDNMCVNLAPSYKCQCYPGFVGRYPDKENCTDRNECELEHLGYSNCSKQLGICTNTPGGFNCTCIKGWVGDGINCTDENECKTGSHECDVNSVCENTNGSYVCICNEGYIMDHDSKTCIDMNDCAPELAEKRRREGRCVNNTVCINEVGTYRCECAPGFVGNGTIECRDVNECLTKPCNANADCINTPGTYECKCRSGWQGDGFQCADINECLAGTHQCMNGNCSNLIGDYSCQCYTGYRPNGKTCDVATDPSFGAQKDECEVDSSSFKCLCKDPEKRESNILCNGLFVGLLIVSVIAIVVLVFVVKYLKRKKDMKIRPARTHRDKYIEMENEATV